MNNLAIRAEKSISAMGVLLWGFEYAHNRLAVADPLSLTTREEGDAGQPMCTVTMDAAQLLFDDLWGAGFRPSASPNGESAQVASMEKHLADLRSILWHKMGITK